MKSIGLVVLQEEELRVKFTKAHPGNLLVSLLPLESLVSLMSLICLWLVSQICWMTLTGTWINLGQAVGWWIRLLSFFFVDAQLIFTLDMLCQSLVIILCLSYENAEPVKARVSQTCEWKQQLIRILLLFRLLSAFYQPTIKHQLAFLWKVQLGLPLRGIRIKQFLGWMKPRLPLAVG